MMRLPSTALALLVSCANAYMPTPWVRSLQPSASQNAARWAHNPLQQEGSPAGQPIIPARWARNPPCDGSHPGGRLAGFDAGHGSSGLREEGVTRPKVLSAPWPWWLRMNQTAAEKDGRNINVSPAAEDLKQIVAEERKEEETPTEDAVIQDEFAIGSRIEDEGQDALDESIEHILGLAEETARESLQLKSRLLIAEKWTEVLERTLKKLSLTVDESEARALAAESRLTLARVTEAKLVAGLDAMRQREEKKDAEIEALRQQVTRQQLEADAKTEQLQMFIKLSERMSIAIAKIRLRQRRKLTRSAEELSEFSVQVRTEAEALVSRATDGKQWMLKGIKQPSAEPAWAKKMQPAESDGKDVWSA